MKKNLTILLLAMVLSCNQRKKELKIKEQTTEIQVDSLKIYNNVLNDLLENYLYHSYLGRDAQYLLADYLVSKKIDSITFTKKLNYLKNKIIFNDSLKGTLYLDEIYSGYERDIKFLDFQEGFKEEEVLLQIRKNNYIPIKAFKTEFVKLKKISNKKVDTLNTFEVGELSLSKFLLNKDKSKGILYFAFICGGDCGEGSIILIKKTNNKWYVEKKQTLWEI